MKKKKAPGGLRIVNLFLLSCVGFLVAIFGAVVANTAEPVVLRLLGAFLVVIGGLACVAFMASALFFIIESILESLDAKSMPSPDHKAKSEKIEDTVYATSDEYERYRNWSTMISEYIDRSLPYEIKLKLYYAIDDLRWCEWPDGFPIDSMKPEYWEDLSEKKKYDYMVELQDIIERSVGEKSLKRYYYQKICNYTDQQFDDWWKSQRN